LNFYSTIIAAVSGLAFWNDDKKEDEKSADSEPEHKGFPWKKASVGLCAVLGATLAVQAAVAPPGKSWVEQVTKNVSNGFGKGK